MGSPVADIGCTAAVPLKPIRTHFRPAVQVLGNFDMLLVAPPAWRCSRPDAQAPLSMTTRERLGRASPLLAPWANATDFGRPGR